MRKYMITFILLCLHGLARGQTEDYNCYYWFDNEQGEPYTSPMVQGAFDVDASALDDGIHTFHYLVAKRDGNISSPTTCYFLKTTSTVSSGQSTCICMIDGKQVYRELLSADGGTIHWDLNASNLDDGLHVLQVVAMTDNGSLSGSYHSYFVKMPEADTTIKGYYWFDDENDVHETTLINGTFEVDASLLSDGFHRFYYQAKYNDGSTSTPSTSYFLKTAQVNVDDELNCICTVDGQLRHIEKLSQQGGVIHWNLDMQDLTDGLHRIQLQAVTPSGALSSSYMSYFMRVTSTDELGEMRFIYAIDNSPFSSDANVVSNGGNYHFDIDLTKLEEGLHYISCMLYNDHGTNTKVQTRFFLKVPLGGNGINWYQYWLNDDDVEQARTVTLPAEVNPLQLMSLLPVESRPFRSSLFHFDVSSGKPMVYARNTIHLRFYDVAMRFTDVAKDYADYNVSQEVNVIKTLESGARETTAWPEENKIKWYQVTAERGDSLSFKLDLAATLQLFSPTGQEVYSASGSDVVKWGGCHVKENGTYYVALHDVAATQGETINIDYEHIDRYAVLLQDVSVVGNGGFTTITFEGNGFDELTSVDLVFGNNIITSTEIGHEGNATTSVKFDFNGAMLGEYKAVFHFSEGDLVVEKCVKVDEAMDIEFDTTVSFNSTFMKWDTNKFVFKINNLGNMTAYNVPMSILIYTQDYSYLAYTKVNGYDLHKYYKNILSDKYTESLATVVNRNMALSGDKYFFVKAVDEDFMPSTPCIHWASISPDLRPGTNEVTVEVKMDDTHRSVSVYLVVPDNWDNNVIRNSARRSSWADNCIKKELPACRSAYEVSKQLNLNYIAEDNRKACIKNKPECNTTHGDALSVIPGDPNDIYGYTAESSSHAIKDGKNEVYYTIEFENDPEIATAPAHNISVADTLDATKFDLSTFAPTRVRIGEKSAELTGEKNFVTTIDMRPEINAIAQVEGTFDEQTGIARWHISSLDPMTMEPTQYVMDGVLPVNTDGQGIGEVMYDIQLKPGLEHGTEVNNRAGIVFDNNDVIMTPSWTNVIDRIAPVSHITSVEQVEDSETATVTIEATDELSGPWRYDVYVQYGSGAWFKAAENMAVGTAATVKLYEGVEHHFYCVATDMAGNVEQKEPETEASLSVGEVTRKGDVNGDGEINAQDASLILQYVARKFGDNQEGFKKKAADANGDGEQSAQDASLILQHAAKKIDLTK